MNMYIRWQTHRVGNWRGEETAQKTHESLLKLAPSLPCRNLEGKFWKHGGYLATTTHSFTFFDWFSLLCHFVSLSPCPSGGGLVFVLQAHELTSPRKTSKLSHCVSMADFEEEARLSCKEPSSNVVQTTTPLGGGEYEISFGSVFWAQEA